MKKVIAIVFIILLMFTTGFSALAAEDLSSQALNPEAVSEETTEEEPDDFRTDDPEDTTDSASENPAEIVEEETFMIEEETTASEEETPPIAEEETTASEEETPSIVEEETTAIAKEETTPFITEETLDNAAAYQEETTAEAAIDFAMDVDLELDEVIEVEKQTDPIAETEDAVTTAKPDPKEAGTDAEISTQAAVEDSPADTKGTKKETAKADHTEQKATAVKKPGKTILHSVTCVANGLKISWKPVSGATGYYIYWWHPVKKQYVRFASTKGTSYVDTTAKAGKHYYYTVAAYNSAGTGDWDYNGLSGIYLPPAKITSISNADSGVKFSWNSVQGASGYRLYWRIKGETKWKKWKDVTTTSVEKAGSKSGTTYEYLVWPYKVYKGQKYWAAETDSYRKSILYLSTPKLLKPKDTKTGLQISWEAVEGAKEYRVYYWNMKKKKYVHFATTTSTSYIDTKAKEGKSYYYTVCAYNGNFYSNWDYSGVLGSYRTRSVLFIGNSLTVHYGISCPNIIRDLARDNGESIKVEKLIHGGASLYDFACGYYKNELVSALQARKYDVIILQEESWTACTKPNKYLRNIKYMMELLNKYGQGSAKIVLYAIQGCTHKIGTSYDTYEKNTLVNLTLAYERIKWNYGYDVEVAKAGELHMQVNAKYPYVNLMQDGNHPNYEGFYLSSMRLYNAIFDLPLSKAQGDMDRYVALNNKEMSINYTWTELKVGESITLKCSGPGSGKVKWSSYDTSVATVSSTGVVKAKQKGKAVILAQSSSGLQQTCVIYVK